MKSPRLASMLLADLFALRERVDTVIAKKVAQERAHWQGKLDELHALGGGAQRRGRPPKALAAADGRKKRRAKAAIKYRGPKKGETWAGRGLTPRWLAAYVKAGKKKESFLVSK